MLARLRYLLAEGFEVASLSGYDDASGQGNAKILFLERDENGVPRVRSEIFDVDHDEMEQCSRLFLSRQSGAQE
ncbi:MAG: hypothetical protein PHQ12_00610 [Chthoniobacteraceae bacterium]|nr:hypothetical protein [Chthoniobacteraceae bacterium]